MAEERITIVVETDGTRSVKRELDEIGKTGTRTAKQLKESWAISMKDAAYNVRVAMNSTKLAEKMRIDQAKLANMAISKMRQSETRAAQEAYKAQVEAARSASKLEVEAARARRRAEQAERQKVRDARRDATFGMGGFGSVIGLLGLKEVISSFAEYSDSATNVHNRLANVTKDEQELTGVTQLLRQSALDSRSEFDLTTRSYARLTQATRQLGLSQVANLSMTETLTKAIAVSGATGAEAHATLIQLSQAMASNRLSADEFRSVAEQLPIVLDLLSDSTGVARTKLKDMGQEGKLTSRVMAIALLEGFDKIQKMFAKTAPTIESAWENIRTQTRFAVADFNKATGAGKAVVDVLLWMANNMSTVASAVKVLGTMVGSFLVVEVSKAAAAMVTLAGANPWTALIVGAAGAITAVRTYREEILDALHITKELKIERNKNELLGFSAQIVNRADKLVMNPYTNKMEPIGDEEAQESRAKREAQHERVKKMLHDEYERDRRKEEIARLKTMDDDIKKTKKGRHIPTFAEAVRPLEEEVGSLTINKGARESMIQTMKVEDQVKRKLTEGEVEYINNLVRSKKAMEDKEKTAAALFEREMQRQKDELEYIHALTKAREEAAIKAQELRIGQLKLENKIYGFEPGKMSDISSPEEIKNTRERMLAMVRGGRLSKDKAESVNNQLEINDERTNPIRKMFLEEETGIGKLKSDMEGIFGTEGTLNKGLSDAIANSIVFHKNFKSQINDLGRSIQAEIISSLVQGLIRMAILGGQGGGSSGAASGGFMSVLGAIGKGKANGGYAPGGRASIVGYHHGGEYVVNAEATQQNMGALDAINKGAKVPTLNGNGGGGGMNITFIDQAGVSLEARQMSRNEVKIIARAEVNKHAPRVIAGSLADQNSRVNKSLRGHTNVRPQR